MTEPTPIHLAPRDGSYVRIVRPSGGFALAYWCRDAWRFANGAQVDFKPVTFQGARAVWGMP